MSIFGGIGSVIGAGLGYLTARNAQQQQAQQALSNQQQQISFAKNAISWKVRDAERAGVHPLYALGAPTMSFSPVSLGSTDMPDFAKALSNAGSSLDTALAQGMPKEAVGASLAASKLQLEGMAIDNDIKRAQLAAMAAKLSQPGAAIVPNANVPFEVPENKKAEERPPLMGLGSRWNTNPNTSPMKAWEDQYGDDGPVSWALQTLIAANDLAYNVGQWGRRQPYLRGWRGSSQLGGRR